MKDEMLKVEGLVAGMLADHPQARDNDRLLLALVWRKQGLSLSVEQWNIFLGGRLSAAESITRSRRKVQENCPGLRGMNYTARQDEEVVMRDAMSPEHAA